ncbi:MAG: GntR family transcriptional regulator [Gaiellales bacterium]
MTEAPPLHEVVRLDLNEQVYAAIKARLLTREFGGGQKISLQTLADQLRVSRTPVHHALTRLATEGLVVSEPRGYVVRPLTVELMSELHDARLALELYCADKTVGHVTAADLAEFRARLEATIKPVRRSQMTDIAAYVGANREFHEFQVDLARNSTISEMYRRLCVFQLQERALLVRDEAAAGGSSEQHNAILTAYEKGDLPAAREALRVNAEAGKEILAAAIESAGGVI